MKKLFAAIIFLIIVQWLMLKTMGWFVQRISVIEKSLSIQPPSFWEYLKQ